MAEEGFQAVVIRLPPALARQVARFVDDHGTAYSSVSEFAEVALRNQLAMEAGDTRHEPNRPDGVPTIQRGTTSRPPPVDELALLSRRPSVEPARFAGAPARSSQPLFVLTNRISPLKLAVRVAANLRDGDARAWPRVEAFHAAAGRAARELGLRLQAADTRDSRTGSRRRAIAYPTGRDESAALNRFIASFTISPGSPSAAGPLAALGLAAIEHGRVALTEAGWSLAQAFSPLIDGDLTTQKTEGETMSDEEAAIVRHQIVTVATGELASVREFIEVVKRGGGAQARVDELLTVRHENWTPDLTAAHRSAMLGRLVDLKVAAIDGRGPAACIRLSATVDEFMKGHGAGE